MNKKLLLSTLVLAGWGFAAYAQNAQEPVTKTFNSVADTWIRENNTTWKQNGSWDKVEIRMDGDDVNGFFNYAALYGFEYQLPQGYKVSNATIRLVTERWKGSDIDLYGYSNDFAESATWDSEAGYIATATKNSPLATFTPKAQRNVALGSDAVGDAYRDISSWTNEIDVTDYVKSLPVSATRANFFLASNDKTNKNQNCFYTREATDVVNAKDATLTFDKEDLVPVLVVTFVEDAASSTERILPEADTQIRLGNATNNATAAALEIKSTSAGDRFYGLMRFKLPSEVLDTEHYELTGATLRLVCTQNKGDRKMGIYDYPNNFAENTVYANESDHVDAALAEEPVATFDAAGFGTMSMGDNKKNDKWSDFTTADKWTSNIDLTDYINGKISDNTGSFNILLKKENEHNDAMKFATKEAVDVTNAATEIDGLDAFTFAAEDLWPMLTISYVKKEVADDPSEDDSNVEFETATDNTVCTIEDGVISVSTANEDSVELVISVPEGTKAVYYMIEPAANDEVEALAAPEGYEEITADANGKYSVTLAVGTSGKLHLQYVDADDNVNDEAYDYSVKYDATLGVNGINGADNGAAVYYNLQGVRVANPERGIFIKVQNGKTSKVIK